MRTGIIIAVIVSVLLLPSVNAVDQQLLYGWTGSSWVPINSSVTTGKLQTTFNLTQAIGIVPKDTETYDLGSSANRWANLYVTRNIYLALSSGSVGIGTSSPISTLDISGNLSVSGSTNSSIDGSTFFVDATNNRVGIGTTTPNESLGIVGNIQLTGNVTPVAQPTSGNATQSISIVDNSITNGIYTWTVIGTDGLPIISYGDFSGSLKVVHCGNIACSAGNTITTLLPGVDTSTYDSIAIAPDGLPVIVYYKQTPDADTYVIKCGTITCSPNSSNTFTRIDEIVSDDPRAPAITIAPDGLPIISYQKFIDSGNAQVRVVKCGNAACSSGNIHSTIQAGGSNFGIHTAISIGVDGLPIVAYKDHANSNLKVAKCGNLYCNASNVITTVDSDGDAGDNIWNIGIPPDGLPIIAETKIATPFSIKVVKCGNIACSSGNTITTLSSFIGGTVPHLAIPPDGLPIIEYRNYSATDSQMVIKCGNAMCSSGNTITNVTADAGLYSSMAIAPDGLPIITYFTLNARDLSVLKCATPNCNQTSSGSYTFGSNLGTIGNFWNNIYSNQFWGKKFQIAAFDVAEKYSSSESLQPGDVVRIDPNGGSNVLKTNGPYQKVAGIISTNPAITLGNWENQDGYPIALAGRVPVKATNENGAINKGDVLVSSSKSGYAMKCSNNNDIDCFGATIGKALEPCNSNECKILVLVSR